MEVVGIVFLELIIQLQYHLETLVFYAQLVHSRPLLEPHFALTVQQDSKRILQARPPALNVDPVPSLLPRKQRNVSPALPVLLPLPREQLLALHAQQVPLTILPALLPVQVVLLELSNPIRGEQVAIIAPLAISSQMLDKLVAIFALLIRTL